MLLAVRVAKIFSMSELMNEPSQPVNRSFPFAGFFSWRIVRRFAFAIACFITLIAIVWNVENWRGKRAWEKHKRQWLAKGEKFTVAEMAPPAVPDDQNFAMSPFIRPLMNPSRAPEGGVFWQDTNALERLKKFQVANSTPERTNRLTIGNAEKGTFADLNAWQEFYRGDTNYPQVASPASPAQTILTALSRFDPELRELREAAARPYSRFPVEYAYEPSFAVLLPHLAQLKAIVQATHVRATAELESKRSDDAFADLKLGCRISDSIKDEPILVSHLVRLAMLGINLQTLREGLLRHAWNDAQLAEFDKYLASLNLLAEYGQAMRGERAFGVGSVDWLRRQGFRGGGIDYLSSPDGQSGSSGVMIMPAGWFYRNMLNISEMHQDFTLPAVDEKAHRAFPKRCEEMETRLHKEQRGPYNILAQLLLPAVSKSVQKSTRMQLFVDAARIACALERYRIANGALPETLDALAPRFIEKLPTDLINGEPLHYRREADGSYLIYSVGWNQTDDGGQIVWGKGSDPAVDARKGDWVWQMPAKLPTGS